MNVDSNPNPVFVVGEDMRYVENCERSERRLQRQRRERVGLDPKNVVKCFHVCSLGGDEEAVDGSEPQLDSDHEFFDQLMYVSRRYTFVVKPNFMSHFQFVTQHLGRLHRFVIRRVNVDWPDKLLSFDLVDQAVRRASDLLSSYFGQLVRWLQVRAASHTNTSYGIFLLARSDEKEPRELQVHGQMRGSDLGRNVTRFVA